MVSVSIQNAVRNLIVDLDLIQEFSLRRIWQLVPINHISNLFDLRNTPLSANGCLDQLLQVSRSQFEPLSALLSTYVVESYGGLNKGRKAGLGLGNLEEDSKSKDAYYRQESSNDYEKNFNHGDPLSIVMKAITAPCYCQSPHGGGLVVQLSGYSHTEQAHTCACSTSSYVFFSASV